MPFTLSHPAIVVPLRRCGLVLSALVVGSMAPDFGFYLALGPLGDRSNHNIVDLLTFCIPAGLAALWIFHRILKIPLLRLMPAALQDGLTPHAQPFAFGPWRRFVLIALSLAVGAFSHLMLDRISHLQGWHGWPLTFLSASVLRSTLVGDIRVVEVIHVALSVAGLLFLAVMAWRAVVTVPCDPARRQDVARVTTARDLAGVTILLALAVAAFFSAVAGAFLLTHTLADEGSRRLAIYRTVVLTVTFLFVELLLVSVAIHAKGIAERVSNSNKQETP